MMHVLQRAAGSGTGSSLRQGAASSTKGCRSVPREEEEGDTQPAPRLSSEEHGSLVLRSERTPGSFYPGRREGGC